MSAHPPEEPVLEMSEIQGLVLPGFNKPHLTLLGVRLPDDGAAVRFKSFLREFAGEVATAAATLGNRRAYRALRRREEARHPRAAPAVVLAGVAFSARGLARLSPGASAIPGEAFQEGLATRSALLGDPTDPAAEGHPGQWRVGAPGAELDALVVVAGDERPAVDDRVADLSARLRAAGAGPVYSENGDVREDLAGHEHFGFDDGVSQPGVRGRASEAGADYVTERHVAPDRIPEAWLYGLPGQQLVWPGEFLLGYPRSSPDPLVPGPETPALPAWTRNGSFLVFRRLRQDVALFWQTMQAEAARLAALPGFQGLTDDRLAALLVGRWPSGAPVIRVPEKDDERLGGDVLANNYFRYAADTEKLPVLDGRGRPYDDPYPTAKADPAGLTCPWAAHIRKVNTRDAGSDVSGSDATYTRRILRLGIPFGRPLADRYGKGEDPERGDRGLLFLCAQASIENQFEFLMARWMNDRSRPKTPGGHDVFVGQNPTPGEQGVRQCPVFGAGLQTATVTTDKRWNVPTGGGYFFVPSVAALREVLAD